MNIGAAFKDLSGAASAFLTAIEDDGKERSGVLTCWPHPDGGWIVTDHAAPCRCAFCDAVRNHVAEIDGVGITEVRAA